MNGEKVLDVQNLSISFKTQNSCLSAVEGLNFHVDKGEVLGIVGESGCGKSISSLAVMDLIEAPGFYSADAIMFRGEDISKLDKEAHRKLRGSGMAMIFQEPLTSLNPLLTVGKQVSEQIKEHTPGISKKECKERSIEMLRKTGIPDPVGAFKNYPAFLSGGMRQRVMIAIALACNPALLIADEPTTALDVTIQAQILHLMKNLQKEFDTAIMFITHDLGVIAETADRVMVMYAGQIVEEAQVMDIFHNPQHPYTRGLLNSTIKVQEQNDRLETIEGVVPTLAKMPKGCRFAPRCPLASEKCRASMPELTKAGEGHLVRCFQAEKGGASHE
ncbi:MAG: ABC transporter ATP-binding protein [Oscillospiraceae bacterium]